MKNFSLKYFVVVILLAFLVSCSSKNQNQIAYDENGNPVQEENVDTGDENTNNNVDEANTEDSTNQEATEENNSQTQNISPKEQAKLDRQEQKEAEKALEQQQKEQSKKEALARDAVLNKYKINKNTFNILETYTIGIGELSKDNNPVTEVVVDEDGNVISESGSTSDRIEPLVISSFNQKDNLQQYITKYFSDYKIIARATFSDKDLLTIDNIKSYGAYIDSSLIILKIYYENSLGLYLYDIYYLNGDTLSEKNYWYRNGTEAVPLEQTLEQLKVSDLNSYDNILPPVTQNPLSNPASAGNSNTKSNLNATGATPTASNSTTNIASAANPGASNSTNPSNSINSNTTNNDNAPNDIQNTEGKSSNETQNNTESTPQTNEDPLRGLSLYDAQDKLLEYRVNKIVGLWKNLITNQLVIIRELPQGNLSLPNKRYGIYVILDEEINNLKINPSLNWITDDLMAEFNILNGDGFYLNREKMLSSATIRLYPAKKLMMLFQHDGKIQYFVPVLAEDIDQKLQDDLYGFIIANNKGEKYDNSTILIQNQPNSKSIKGYNTFFTGWVYPVAGIILFTLLVSI